MRRLAAALAFALASAGCIFLVEDPRDWVVVSPDDAGADGADAGGKLQCYGGDTECHCEPTTNAYGSQVCDGTTVPDALCCADLEYPAPKTGCNCTALSCKRDLDGCTCRVGSSNGPSTSCSPKADEVCCISGSECICGAPADCKDKGKVARCDVSVLTCGSRVATTTCMR